MIRVDDDAVEVDFDEEQARLHVKGLQVFDDHDVANSLSYGLGLPGTMGFPLIPGVFPKRATVSFDVEWNGMTTAADIHNASQSFEGSFFSTPATIQWSAEQPGFQYQSEGPDPSRNLFSVLGREKNGVFFL
jgi:hypothetical protein